MFRYFIVLISFITIALSNEYISKLDKLEVYDSTISNEVVLLSEDTTTTATADAGDIYTFTDDEMILKKDIEKKSAKKSIEEVTNKPIQKDKDIVDTTPKNMISKPMIQPKKGKKQARKKRKKQNIKPIINTHTNKLTSTDIDTKDDPKSGLNLRDAIIKAIARNKKILSLREKVIQAKRVVDQKRAGLFPMINITGETSKNINTEEGQEDTDNFFKDEAQISITQNIYAGGKTINDIKKAKADLAAATSKYQQGLEKEILSIIQAYLNVIYEKKSIKANRENIKALNKILDIVTLKEKSGAATKGDLNYIKSNIENTRSELVMAESKYKNAISYYEYFVGKIDDGNYPIEENIKVSINPNANIEALVEKNPQLREIASKIEKFKYEMESRKSRFKPTIDLILTKKHKTSTLDSDPTQTKQSAALTFNYPLYNGGRDEALVFESKSRVDELKYKYIDLKKSLTFNAIQILNNINSTQESLAHIKKQYKANKKVVDAYWNGFKYGNQDLQALLLAQNALNRSQLDMLNSQKTYINQYFQLLSSVGALLRYFGIEYLVDVNGINQKARLHMFRSDFDD